MAYSCGGSAHLGGGLSLIEALAVLYGDVMNASLKTLSYSEKDKFLLSKGHGVLGYYAALAEFGIIEENLLDTFMQDGSDFIAHPVMKTELGMEASTGSLGQGISLAVGMALSAKKKNYGYKTYVICGNGECNEGSVWEAALSASFFKLKNLTVIIDENKLQYDGPTDTVLSMHSIEDKWKSFGFDVISCNGHSLNELQRAFTTDHEIPLVVIAKTLKGKGISYMENNPAWHNGILTSKLFDTAMDELEKQND